VRAYKDMAVVLSFTLFFVITTANIAGALDKVPLSKILHDESIEAMTYWNFGDDNFLVVVNSYIKKVEGLKLTGRKLVFYKKQTSGFVKAFEHDAQMDHFVGMIPLGDYDKNLMTVWVGGSAYHFNAFTVSNGKVISVLEAGSHNYPEFADIDNDGQVEVLISEGAFLIDAKENKVLSYPDKANVYKWDGKSYALIKTVPWKTRFNAGELK